MKLASFDLEIAKDLGNDINNWQKHVPLGISCGAVAFSDSFKIKFWEGRQAANPDEPARPNHMTKPEAIRMVRDLEEMTEQGYSIVTWNGAGFDFQVLAIESGMYAECGRLALDHIDMMLLVTFTKGWFLGLQSALDGHGLKGKLKSVTLNNGTELTDMSGAKAPELWATGEYAAVLAYLAEDVNQPLMLAKDIIATKSIRWTSRKGSSMKVPVPKLLTVRECFTIPEPDVSWMDSPPTRDQFVSWIPGWESLL